MRRKISLWRLVFLAVWSLSLFFIPSFLIKMGWAIEGSGVILAGMLLPLCILILSSKKAVQWGAIILTCLIAFNLFRPPQVEHFLDDFDFRIQSLFFRLRGLAKPSGEVVIVDVDTKSIERLGQWPWPRTHFSKVIEKISQDKPKVIGLDIVFPEKDNQSVSHFHKILEYFLRKGIAAEGAKRIFVPGDKIKESILKLQKEKLELEDTQEDVFQAYFELHPEMKTLSRDEVCLAMAKDLSLMHYLDTSWEDVEIFEKGAYLIIDSDAELAKTFSENKVVGGGWIQFALENKLGDLSKKEDAEPFKGMVLNYNYNRLKPYLPHLKRGGKVVINTEVVQEGLNYQGAFNIIPDASGSARYYTLLFEADFWIEKINREGNGTELVNKRMIYPSLGLEMLRVGGNYDQVVFKKEGAIRALTLQNIKEGRSLQIPVTNQVEIPVNFLGFGGPYLPHYSTPKDYFFTYYSFSDILKGNFKKGSFKDKYVFLGSTDPTLSDLIGSPFRAGFPALEVQAIFVDNIVSGNKLVDYGDATRELKYYTFIILGCLFILFVGYIGPLWGGIATLIILTAVPTLAYFFMTTQGMGVVMGFSYEWFSIALLGALVLLLGYLETSKDRRFLQEQFGSMVSADVLDKLKSDPQMRSLEGSKSTVSVLFSDIESFTTISERLPPQALVDFLNKYFTPMTDVILGQQGFIDKFIGDAIMACWGVPFPQEDHAMRACAAILGQMEKIQEIAPTIKKEFDIDLHVRFGTASGVVSSAMVGSESRKNYTVLGDVVNTAARLEPLCKFYGVSALVSENTYLGAKEHYIFRFLDKVIVKGKEGTVSVYALLGRKGDKVFDEELDRAYKQAFELYTERKWDEALNVLNRIIDRDPLSCKLKETIELFKKMPPPEGWIGERIFTTK